MKPKTSTLSCPPGALPGGPRRTRFFDGMFLSQADLENEQNYWRLKRRLTNRALGTGVVWGLRLRWDDRQRAFSLSPGYALDCCGNDLIVECATKISERDLAATADPAVKAAGTKHAYVALQYAECAEDGRAAHADACTGTSGNCQPARVRETARLLLVPPPVRQPTPPEELLADFDAWKAALTAEARGRIFPISPPTTAPSASGDLPFEVRATIPGTTNAVGSVRPRTGVAQQLGPIGPATQTPATSQRTAIIELELVPDAQFGFFDGQILDQGRIVERVDPPVARSMFWSIDLTVDGAARGHDARFEFTSRNLGYQELFGARTGRADLVITVGVRVTGGNQLNVEVTELTVSVQNATLTVEPGNRTRCLDDLATAWAVDPARAGELGKALLLSATYAYLAEMSTGASARQIAVAQAIYATAWHLLFGADLARATLDERRQLGLLLQELFEAWCAGFMYPGPRCLDEHHGVYLGSVELGDGGSISSFNGWDNRRYVVTGALIGYWAEQVGVAPLDVVVGRIASALCCVASLPIPDGNWNGRGQFGNGLSIGLAENASSVTWGELVERAIASFTSLGQSGSEKPNAVANQIKGQVDELAASARAPVTDFVTALANDLPVSSLKLSANASATASQLDAAQISVGALVSRQPESVIAQLGTPPAALDEIYAAAETTTRAVASAAGKAAANGFSRTKLTDAAFLSAVKQTLAGRVDGARIDEAAKAARGSS